MHIHYIGQGATISNSHETLYLNSKQFAIFNIVSRNSFKYNEKYIMEKNILKDIAIKFSLKDKEILNPMIKRFIQFINLDLGDKEYIYTGVEGMYYPQMLVLFITNRCFHNCVHCFRNSSPNSDEMSIENIKYILDKVRGKVPHIVLSGGEPLIHKDIKELLNNIYGFSSASMVTSLYGFKTDLINSLDNFSEIQISIYGWDERSHDNFTNSKGSFVEIWEKIELLINRGKNIIITSMNNNLSKLEDITRLCISYGVKRLQFGDIVPIGRAKLNRKKISHYEVDKKYILDLQAKYNDKIEILYEEGCFSDLKSDYCSAGINKLDIDEYGNVYSCLFGTDLSFGNIIKDKKYFNTKLEIDKKIVNNTNIKCPPLKKLFNK